MLSETIGEDILPAPHAAPILAGPCAGINGACSLTGVLLKVVPVMSDVVVQDPSIGCDAALHAHDEIQETVQPRIVESCHVIVVMLKGCSGAAEIQQSKGCYSCLQRGKRACSKLHSEQQQDGGNGHPIGWNLQDGHELLPKRLLYVFQCSRLGDPD